MTPFPLLCWGLRKRIGHGLHHVLQQCTAVLVQCFAQSHLGGFQISYAVLRPLLPHEGYEGLGFFESFLVAFGRFEEFFFLASSEHSNRVI